MLAEWPYGYPWLTWSPTLPQWALDVKNPQHELHMIECLVGAVCEYQAQKDDKIAELEARVAKLEDEAKRIPELENAIIDLAQKVDAMAMGVLVYDPTKGEFTNSINQARRLVSLLATPDAALYTVDKVGKLTVANLGEHEVAETVNSGIAIGQDGIGIPDQEVAK